MAWGAAAFIVATVLSACASTSGPVTTGGGRAAAIVPAPRVEQPETTTPRAIVELPAGAVPVVPVVPVVAPAGAAEPAAATADAAPAAVVVSGGDNVATTGTIEVHDTSGSTLRLLGDGVDQSAVAEDGIATFADLPPGEYALSRTTESEPVAPSPDGTGIGTAWTVERIAVGVAGGGTTVVSCDASSCQVA